MYVRISCTKDSREKQQQINIYNLCDQKVPDLIKNNSFLTSSKKCEHVLFCVIIKNTGIW
jgi:hypothetical protein